MKIKQIGIGIIIAAIFTLGIGIGLKFNNPETEMNSFTIAGLVLNSIGLFVLLYANKKKDN